MTRAVFEAAPTDPLAALVAAATLREAIAEREEDLAAQAFEAGATVRSLAEALGVSKSAVHRRFRPKTK